MKKSLVALAMLITAATATQAQSLDRTVGTGNVLPFRYGPTNTDSSTALIPQNSLQSYAMVPRAHSTINSNAPENTGGGTADYNERLLHD